MVKTESATKAKSAPKTESATKAKSAPKAKDKPIDKTSRPIVVDGTNHIAGRLCSNIAKLLLQGNRVSIINSENIMISGRKQNIVGEYREFLEISSILHPKHGPFHPRKPDTIISRMIRGMLPRDKPSGQAALKRLRAYVGVPKELKSIEKTQFEKSIIRKSNAYYTSMGELGKYVGWNA